MTIAEWLEGLGLRQYGTVFAENDIDFDVLSELGESDLEKLGMSLGHRRKLLRAIADRKAAPAKPATEPPADAAGDAAERRQVTVMFCDLVGSTELANAVDPEEMRLLLRRFREAGTTAIARFDGFVAKFMGDSVLAYFGYPRAHEDAVGQSVRAARAIIEDIASIRRPDGPLLEARAGIATGLVVVGDLVGAGAAREHAIVGETPNLAARLQALAEPNTIFVGETTRQLLGGQFECRARGEHALKGFARPVPVWQVVRESALESRYAAAGGAREPAPLVGRGDEMSRLLEQWRQTSAGTGQALLIQAEAGMGKSRLVDALFRRIADEPHARVLCQCSPYHSNSALYPVIRHLELAAGFAAEDSAPCKLDKLAVLLAAGGPRVDATTSLLADLLSLPTDGRYPPLELAPAQRKAAIIAALIDQLARLAVDRPVLFVVEDAHWIDPTTQEFVARLFEGIGKTRILGLVTARPEYRPPQAGPVLATFALPRLGKDECAALVAGTAASRALEPEVIDEIVTKADGIPLFIEELTKAVTESATPDRPVVPATLQDSLMARLDRLGSAKEIGQIAAVIGQRFTRTLLDAVAVERTADVAPGLARLVEAGLVLPQGRTAGAEYRFSHGLMRDIAYENLLRSRRRQIHERIGRAIVDRFPNTAETEPEVVAHHFSNAQLPDLAGAYHERAGDRAAARFAFAEAVAHFGAGRAEAAKAADAGKDVRRDLALLLKMGPALSIIKGPQSPEVEQTYRLAHDAGEKSGDHDALFKATWGLWFSANHSRRLEVARDRAQELVALSARVTDPDLGLEALHCRWSTAFFRGEVTDTLRDSSEGMARYDRARHSWMGPVFGGHDPGVCAHQVNAFALSFTGRASGAERVLDGAIALAEKLGHPHSLGFALLNSVCIFQTIGDRDAVVRIAQRLREVADKYNFPPMRAHAQFLAGWARASGDDIDAGLATMEAEYPRATAIGPLYRYYAAILAETRAKAGRVAEALELLQWALGTVTEPGIGMFVPELNRLRGECLLRLADGREDDGHRALQGAAEIARQRGATLFELRAVLSRARAAGHEASERRQPLRELLAGLPAEFDAPERATAMQFLAG